MSNTSVPPYERVQLFSGGGSRFGYYLGSYAALVAHDLRPDMIIGTCGGSLSAYLVQLAPDPSDLRQLMRSPALYQAIRAIRHVSPHEANKRLKLRYMTNALKRWRLSQNTSKGQQRRERDHYQQMLEELQQLAMFRIDSEDSWLDKLSQFAPSTKCAIDTKLHKAHEAHKAPEIAIIASRLCQIAINGLDSRVDSLPATDFQLQELLFAPTPLIKARLAVDAQNPEDTLNPTLSAPVYPFASGRIRQSVKMITEWDTAAAVRASMADMYYLPPTYIDDLGWCLGGVINLTPIELACQLGNTVFAETKAGYDTWLAAPAIQRVFGFDPNQRLAQVHDYKAAQNQVTTHQEATNQVTTNQKASAKRPKHARQLHRLPFADNGKQLAGQNVRKRLSLRQMTVELIHRDYDGFVTQMEAQWQYGYERTSDYIRQQGL